MNRTDGPVLGVVPLGFQWPTIDPFLFCVHHLDRYPKGNAEFGPAASLEGRDIGQDFAGKDGWRMYHGETVPGFPSHPHRGFETVTIVRRGYIDHADSLGAAARFGGGDVQWLTAGAGIVHAEMFPLLARDGENTVELFQIWLNLPAKRKMVPAHFRMFWAEQIPKVVTADAAGRRAEVTVIAGRFGDATPLAPPPDSYAAEDDAQIAIWTVDLDPGASVSLPAAGGALPAAGGATNDGIPPVVRIFYLFEGDVTIAGTPLSPLQAAQLDGGQAVTVTAGATRARALVLQGRPLDEPVAQQGPFVMNTREELQTAFRDYQRTRFGGWPWERPDPVHADEPGRFARHADGTVERHPR